MSIGNIEISQRKAARIAGISYLSIIVLGIFAEFFVRGSLIVPGDAPATAKNISESMFLFQVGIASDLIMLGFDILVAWSLYILLRQVNQNIALLATWLRLIHATVYGAVLLVLFFVYLLLSGADYLTSIGPDQLHTLVLLLLNGHSYGYDLGLVFFGFHCFVLGYLVYMSGFIPKILGVLLVGAAIAYLAGSFTRFLFPDYVEAISPIYIVALVAELSISLWLLIKGGKLKT